MARYSHLVQVVLRKAGAGDICRPLRVVICVKENALQKYRILEGLVDSLRGMVNGDVQVISSINAPYSSSSTEMQT